MVEKLEKKQKLTIEQLVPISKQLILWNQHPSGGYTACPLFSHYSFSWLRDGSFIANAMDVTGETDSAELFYMWVNRIMLRLEDHIESLLQRNDRGETIAQHEFLHTRYQLDGRDDEHSEWGHFQLDGYGAWIWGLVEHYQAIGQQDLPESVLKGVDLAVRYLCAFWKQPNFDCWEERSDQLHPSTLACIYGGLSAVGRFMKRPDLEAVCLQIQQFVLKHMVHPEGNYLLKSIRPCGDNDQFEHGYVGVDSSSLWLFEPFHVLPAEHPVMKATLAKIEADLKTAAGGIKRYTEDGYYGGGEWILLTAWYGLAAASTGKRSDAGQALQWIADQADALGRLPEQVPHSLPDKGAYEGWVNRWGPPAAPLLWSHAMFLVLYCQLNRA
jgi:GH15 family glucan-1,4-alpha-glucosidase